MAEAFRCDRCFNFQDGNSKTIKIGATSYEVCDECYRDIDYCFQHVNRINETTEKEN